MKATWLPFELLRKVWTGAVSYDIYNENAALQSFFLFQLSANVKPMAAYGVPADCQLNHSENFEQGVSRIMRKCMFKFNWMPIDYQLNQLEKSE